jgi:hypothetical protein
LPAWLCCWDFPRWSAWGLPCGCGVKRLRRHRHCRNGMARVLEQSLAGNADGICGRLAGSAAAACRQAATHVSRILTRSSQSPSIGLSLMCRQVRAASPSGPLRRRRTGKAKRRRGAWR